MVNIVVNMEDPGGTSMAGQVLDEDAAVREVTTAPVPRSTEEAVVQGMENFVSVPA